VQVVQSSHSLHNLHNQKPMFEPFNYRFLITAAAKTARGGLAPA